MRISDWSSVVCSSDLRALAGEVGVEARAVVQHADLRRGLGEGRGGNEHRRHRHQQQLPFVHFLVPPVSGAERQVLLPKHRDKHAASRRSEEHTSELQSLMRISYAVFCLKKTKTHTSTTQ